ncbi:glycosyltransferase [Gordonia phage Ronaldo]|uniref:Glycosyltransferase n=2 Tax=Ronaldovirus ronaldo TaxID=2734270 RepID=A0A6B9LEM7_9CAUD|nr:glycosyltransferase [Gordonia phage Ronaldo]AXN53684.1 glycosyltransferase [Gordonia phage Ronaldo]QHB38238.1 glycosyltransferase [Gordonia phage Volt]
MIDLSILVCSTHTRWDNFAQKIQEQLWGQYNLLTPEDQERVEILILTDNKKMMLGEKRNVMVDMAQGKYVVFVDDDDRIAEDYISELLSATESGCDVITFMAMVSLNGGAYKPCHYSKDVEMDYNVPDAYYRIPNHICCVKRELAQQVSFPNKLYGEDSAYSKLLLPLLNTEYRLDRYLYFYDYNSKTTETQQHMNGRIRKRQNVAPIVDVIILSNAQSSMLKRMTQEAIDTCLAGANSLPVNIIVVEQNTRIEYKNATTHHCPESFHYNYFANEGALLGNSEWIMVSNNDVVFHDGWLHELLAANHPVVSPISPKDVRQQDITENELGTQVGRHLSGWCFMISREMWCAIGGFDERVSFWGSDDVVVEQVLREGVKPMVVANSVVDHLGSQTLKRQSSNKQNELTWEQLDILIDILGSHRLQNHPEYVRWKKSRVTVDQ